MRVSYVVAAIVLAVVIILALQFWPDDASVEAEGVTAPVEVAPRPVELKPATAVEPELVASDPVAAEPLEPEPDIIAAPAPVQLPDLYESDEFVREEVTLWGLPELWLQYDSLIARFAVLVANAADGSIPRSQLGFLSPTKPFKARKRGEQFFVDETSYERFDGVVDIVLGVPPDSLADFVNLCEPLIDEALAQIGRRDGARHLLDAALGRIGSVPVLGREVELVRPVVVYKFADPDLEALPELEKQLLRMGPVNVGRLQQYAQTFARAYAAKN